MMSLARERSSSKIVQAYIERRHRVWVQVKAENPEYTQAEIEARMEQFGV
jgi:hypothetical protein